MKPVYTNFFVVRKNETNTEVIVDFLHNYSGVETEVGQESENKTNLQTKISLESEKVGSFVFNMNDAIGLRDILTNVIFETETETENKK